MIEWLVVDKDIGWVCFGVGVVGDFFFYGDVVGFDLVVGFVVGVVVEVGEELVEVLYGLEGGWKVVGSE